VEEDGSILGIPLLGIIKFLNADVYTRQMVTTQSDIQIQHLAWRQSPEQGVGVVYAVILSQIQPIPRRSMVTKKTSHPSAAGETLSSETGWSEWRQVPRV
jgi:hypothetical protein